MDRVSICESLLKRNEIEPFLKRVITRDEKWITYDNNVRKRWWSKPGEASQTVANPALTPRLVFGGIGKEFMMSCANLAKPLIRLSTDNN